MDPVFYYALAGNAVAFLTIYFLYRDKPEDNFND